MKKDRVLLFAISVYLCLGVIGVYYLKKDSLSFSKFVPTEKKTNANTFLSAEDFYKKKDYETALALYQTVLKTALKKKDTLLLIQCQIKMANCYRFENKFDNALTIIDSAESLFMSGQFSNNLLQAEIFLAKGSVLMNTGKNQLSIQLLNQSVSLFVKILGKNNSILSLPYNNIGTNYLYLGDFKKSIEYYTKALSIAQKNAIIDKADIAMYHQNLGIAFARTGDYDRALMEMNTNLQINQNILKQNDPALGNIYLNFGQLNYLFSQYKKAENYLNKAEQIFKKNKKNKNYELSLTLLNKGNIFNAIADYDKALEYYLESISILKSVYNESHPYYSLLYSNIGYVYMQKGMYSKALSYLFKSLQTYHNTSDKIRIYRNLAKCYQQINDKNNATLYFEKSIEIAESINGISHVETAQSYLEYAKYLSQTGNYKKSIDYFNISLSIYKNKFGEKNRDVANCYTHIGILYYNKHDYNTSTYYFHKALVSQSPVFNNGNLLTNPDVNALPTDYYALNALTYKANALLNNYIQTTKKRITYLKASFETYSLALALTERIRMSYLAEDSKYLINSEQKNMVNAGLYTALQLYKVTGEEKYLEKSFEFSEKGKYAILLSGIKELEATQIGNVPRNLLEKEREIKHRLSVYENYLYTEKSLEQSNSEKIVLWEKKIFNLNQQHDSLEKTLETSYSDYYKLKYSTQTIGARQVQEKVHPDQACISYVLSDSLLFTFCITKTEIIAYQTPVNQEFGKNLTKMRSLLTQYDALNYTRLEYDSFIQTSRNLYKILIEPIADKIKGKSLKIIPDDKLGYLPFEVLLTCEPRRGRMNFKTLPYLFLQNDISYSYSTTINFSKNKKHNFSNVKVLAFAPDYQAYGNKNPIFNLPSLPAAQDEIKCVKDIVGGKIFTGKDATEANFKKKAGKYSILHLAMHTQINDENPIYSRLIFSPSPDSLNEGLLYAYELFNMKLNAQLAMLSACNTGSGKLSKGEGIMSMARGFIYAGVPSIILTLWSVNDASSADLVKSFYQYLSKGLNKDQALQLAKKDYLLHTDPLKSHPFFWAAYVEIGDTNPINKGINYLWWIIAGLVITTTIITGAVIIARRIYST
ncbi:MAG: tetratricopeptide repeat protein [Lentimicrobiaceae bacterium]|nr:tetratricopeptide repeat protein [Lentimicrobiaceae bacterium]